MNGEQVIGWFALAVQCVRFGVPLLAGAWGVFYGMRGFLRMLAP